LFLLGAIGALVFCVKYDDTFPSASIELKVSRGEIAQMAGDWAKQLGYKKEKTIDCTTFEQIGYDVKSNTDIKAFLELALGTEEANKLMRKTIPVWDWSSRLCQENSLEEFSVALSTEGKFLGFVHTIPNDLQIPSVSHAAAEKIAREFLLKYCQDALIEHQLVSNETRSQLRRLDHIFVWEDRSHDYQGARIHKSIRVSGNIVTLYGQSLHLPESWKRQYASMRSHNDQLYALASVFYTALIFIGIVIFFRATSKHQIRWQSSIIAAGLFSLIQLLEKFNDLPIQVMAYNPLSSFQNYITGYIVNSITFVGGLFAIAVILTAAAEYLYRTQWPQRIALENWLKPRALTTSEFSRGLLVAHLVAFAYLGWAVGYYVVGKQFGFYTPISVENYQAMASSLVPAFGAVSLGTFAAVHEELIYRIFALNLSRMLLERLPWSGKGSLVAFWLSNLFQAAAWGFMHSNYAQQPAFARGLELTVSGLLFGWTFQNFGLLPCLVGHYLIDSFLTARPLLNSEQPLLAMSALLAIIPFGILCAIALVQRARGQVTNDALLANMTISTYFAPRREEATRHFKYTPIKNVRRIAILAWLPIAALAAIVCGSANYLGKHNRMTLNRQQAIAIANRVMADKQRWPEQYHAVAVALPDVTDEYWQYIFEQKGLDATLKYATLADYGYSWTVRYYKPTVEQEQLVLLDGHGKNYTFEQRESEETPGPSLTEYEARILAEAYVRATHREFEPFRYDSVQETRRRYRMDYLYTFESPLYRIGDAPCISDCEVIGNDVANFSQRWNVPDQWKQDRKRQTWKDTIANIAQKGYVLLVIVLVGWWMIGVLRTGVVRWRAPIIIGAVMTLFAAVSYLNGLPILFKDYDTAIPVNTFLERMASEDLKQLMGRFVEFLFTSAFSIGAFKLLYAKTSLLSLFRVAFRPANAGEQKRQRQLWLDALICGYSFSAIRWAIDNFSFFLTAHFSPNVPTGSLDWISAYCNTIFPFFDITSGALMMGLRELFNTGFFVGLYYKYAGSFKKVFFIAIALVLIQFSADRYWQDYVIHVGRALLQASVFYLMIAKFARGNIFAYFVYGFSVELLSKLVSMIGHAPKVLLLEIVASALLLLLPAFWVGYVFFLKERLVSGDGAREEDDDEEEKGGDQDEDEDQGDDPPPQRVCSRTRK
jgi:hypothetical protein